ncbi:MAG TPA: YggT family protein [Candidatus Limnocylindrales bacterium]|nr:YggT family protein [Candidatus Limnocylindrales bacterium]
MDVPTFFRVFVQLLVTVLFLIVTGRVLMSWVNPRFEGPVARFLFETTEPMLSPIRRILPQSGMIDLSPMVLGFVLLILMRIVLLR